jgi:hypothetical protein
MNADNLLQLYMSAISDPVFWLMVVLVSVVQGSIVYWIKK